MDALSHRRGHRIREETHKVDGSRHPDAIQGVHANSMDALSHRRGHRIREETHKVDGSRHPDAIQGVHANSMDALSHRRLSIDRSFWQAARMGISIKSGPWDVPTIKRWLHDTVIPIRLATSGQRGPLVQSLWFDLQDDAIWCATQRDSAVAKRVRKHPVAGWEVSPDQPPYRGVRGQGTIEIIDDAHQAGEVLKRLISRYEQSGTQLESWLLGRISTEVAFRIFDLEVISWDYSPRMTGS